MTSRNDESLGLTAQEVASAFTDPVWAHKFPPVMTIDEAAEMLQVPKSSIYGWRSQGLLGKCGRRVGKYVRFWRDRLILKLMNEGLISDDEL
jgi:hypothetical protein